MEVCCTFDSIMHSSVGGLAVRSPFYWTKHHHNTKGSTFVHQRSTVLRFCFCHCIWRHINTLCFPFSLFHNTDQLFSHPLNINHLKCWDNLTVGLFMAAEATAAYLSHFFKKTFVSCRVKHQLTPCWGLNHKTGSGAGRPGLTSPLESTVILLFAGGTGPQ